MGVTTGARPPASNLLTLNLPKDAGTEEKPRLLTLTPQQTQRLDKAPLGHLSTASISGVPHVIPVCFALDADEGPPSIYIVLDRKPKQVTLTRLRRVRNILENPQVSLVVDHYDADWTKLWYILLTGTAQLLAEGRGKEGLGEDGQRRNAIHLLRQKYPQYRDMDIDDNPVIKIVPERAVAWSYTPEPAS